MLDLKLRSGGVEGSASAEEFFLDPQLLKRKPLCCFEKSGSTVPMTRCHIAEAFNPQYSVTLYLILLRMKLFFICVLRCI